MNARSKYWCWTLNNYTLPEEIAIRELSHSEGAGLYLIYGREGKGPDDTPHLQGFIAFPDRRRGTQVKALLSPRTHVEKKKKTLDQAADYCKKEGDFLEFGTRPVERAGQGKRVDLEQIRTQIVDGATDLELADSHFGQWVFHRRAFNAYRQLLDGRRNFASEVHVYWGDTGTGKTRKVHDAEADLWTASDNQLVWFDGYQRQPAVLFDDFVGCKNSKFGFLLRLLDRYPMQVPVKGGFVNWAPKRIYITSNLDPRNWFLGVTAAQELALRRRFTSVTHFGVLRS